MLQGPVRDTVRVQSLSDLQTGTGIERWNSTADQDGCTAPRCRSVCAVADIIGKPEGLNRVKECLT